MLLVLQPQAGTAGSHCLPFLSDVDFHWDEADTHPRCGHGDIKQGNKDLKFSARLIPPKVKNESGGKDDKNVNEGEDARYCGSVLVYLILRDDIACIIERERH